MKQLSLFMESSKEIHSTILEAKKWFDNATQFTTFPQEINEKFTLFIHGKNDSFKLGKRYKITIQEIE